MKQPTAYVLIAILMLTGCGQRARQRGESVSGQQNQPSATPVSETASPSDDRAGAGPSRLVLAEGEVVAAVPALTLSFETSGRLVSLNVEPGGRVEFGETIATLADGALEDAVTSAELQVAQAETTLAGAELSLENLVTWEPDAAAVAAAEADLAAAQAALEEARGADAVAGDSLTSARIAVEQAERELADAQEYYDNVFDPARDWEQYIKKRICYRGEGGVIPCTGPFYDERIKAQREEAPRRLQAARDNLEVARAQYNVARGGVDDDKAVAARASVASAQQALERATTGPKPSEIEAARLEVRQAEISLEQSRLSLAQAQDNLDQTRLAAPRGGTVLSVEVAVGAAVGAGTPIVTILDTDQLEFHTTNLSERDLSKIAPGQEAVVTLKAYLDEEIDAEVTRIGVQAGAPVGGAATFPVILALGRTDLDLRPGMTGEVEIGS